MLIIVWQHLSLYVSDIIWNKTAYPEATECKILQAAVVAPTELLPRRPASIVYNKLIWIFNEIHNVQRVIMSGNY